MKFYPTGVQPLENFLVQGAFAPMRNAAVPNMSAEQAVERYAGAESRVMEGLTTSTVVRGSSSGDMAGLIGMSMPDDCTNPALAVSTVIWLQDIPVIFYHQLPIKEGATEEEIAEMLPQFSSSFWNEFRAYLETSRSHWLATKFGADLTRLIKLSVVTRHRVYGFYPSAADPKKPRLYHFVCFQVDSLFLAEHVVMFLAQWTFRNMKFDAVCESPVQLSDGGTRCIRNATKRELYILSLLHMTVSKWVHLSDSLFEETSSYRRTYMRQEVTLRSGWLDQVAAHIHELPSEAAPPPPVFKMLHFDIETFFPHNADTLPQPSLKDAKIFSIAFSLYSSAQSDPLEKIVAFVAPETLHLDRTLSQNADFSQDSADASLRPECIKSYIEKKVREAQGVSVMWASNERELLKLWRTVVLRIDPDILVGYNSNSYDLDFIYKRSIEYQCGAEYFSRMIGVPATTRSGNISTGQGTKTRFELNCPGRAVVDLFQLISAQHNYESYKLSAVAQELLSKRLPPEEVGKMHIDDHLALHQAYKSGEAQGLINLILYNLHDTKLTGMLFEVKQTLNETLVMCMLTGCTQRTIFLGGQQCRTFGALMKRGHEKNYIFDPPTLQRPVESYEGGAVHEPVTGAYFDYVDEPTQRHVSVLVSVLDFASLYPSLMISFKLCFTTLLIESEAVKLVLSKCAQKLSVTMEEMLACFTKDHDGLLSGSNQDWAVHRKATKRTLAQVEMKIKNLELEMKQNDTKDPSKYAEQTTQLSTLTEELRVLDARQKALKLLMNASYGFTGTGNDGMYPCWLVAMAVTLCGRNVIHETEEFALMRREFTNLRPEGGGDAFDVVLTPSRTEMLDATGDRHVIYVQIIYGDTDSIMPKLECLKQISDGQMLALGKVWASAITKYFQTKFTAMGYNNVVLKIDFEKWFRGYMLLGKKRYTGLKFCEGENPKVSAAGLEIRRRDNPLFLREMMSMIIDSVTKNNGKTSEAMSGIRGMLEKLVNTCLAHVPQRMLEQQQKKKSQQHLEPRILQALKSTSVSVKRKSLKRRHNPSCDVGDSDADDDHDDAHEDSDAKESEADESEDEEDHEDDEDDGDDDDDDDDGLDEAMLSVKDDAVGGDDGDGGADTKGVCVSEPATAPLPPSSSVPVAAVDEERVQSVKETCTLEEFRISVQCGENYANPCAQAAAHLKAQLEGIASVYTGTRVGYVMAVKDAVCELTNTEAARALRAKCKENTVAASCLAERFASLSVIDYEWYVERLRNPIGNLLITLGYNKVFVDSIFDYYKSRIALITQQAKFNRGGGGAASVIKVTPSTKNPFDLLGEDGRLPTKLSDTMITPKEAKARDLEHARAGLAKFVTIQSRDRETGSTTTTTTTTTTAKGLPMAGSDKPPSKQPAGVKKRTGVARNSPALKPKPTPGSGISAYFTVVQRPKSGSVSSSYAGTSKSSSKSSSSGAKPQGFSRR